MKLFNIFNSLHYVDIDILFQIPVAERMRGGLFVKFDFVARGSCLAHPVWTGRVSLKVVNSFGTEKY